VTLLPVETFCYRKKGMPELTSIYEVTAMRNRFCTWDCGEATSNRSGICDGCWCNGHAIYQARKAIEAAQAPKPKELSAGKRASLSRARGVEARQWASPT
jgi:hypothetical protein